MRILRGVLLLVGAPALGAMVCGLGFACLLAATAFRTRPGQDPSLDWGGAVAFLFCGGCGGAFGAVAGLGLAARWLGRHGSDPWRPATRVGVGLGLAAAVGIRSSGVLEHHVAGAIIHSWPGTAGFLSAAGTLGGLAGSLVPVPRKRKKKRSRPG